MNDTKKNQSYKAIKKILIQSKFCRDNDDDDLDENGKDYQNLELCYTVTISLEQFILLGNYTNRKNKQFVLKNCLLYSPNEIARILAILPQSVRTIQRDIYKDFAKEMGNDILELLQQKKYKKIGQRLDCANKRIENNNQFAFKEVEQLAKIKGSDIACLDDKINKCFNLLRDEITNKTLIKDLSFNTELQILNMYNKSYFNELLGRIDVIKFLTLITILKGDMGSINLRNHIQKLLNKLQP